MNESNHPDQSTPSELLRQFERWLLAHGVSDQSARTYCQYAEVTLAFVPDEIHVLALSPEQLEVLHDSVGLLNDFITIQEVTN